MNNKTNISCKKAEELLILAETEDVTHDESQMLDAHLARCSACRQARRELAEISQLLTTELGESVDVDPTALRRWEAAAVGARPAGWRLTAWAAAAAVMIIGILAALLKLSAAADRAPDSVAGVRPPREPVTATSVVISEEPSAQVAVWHSATSVQVVPPTWRCRRLVAFGKGSRAVIIVRRVPAEAGAGKPNV